MISILALSNESDPWTAFASMLSAKSAPGTIRADFAESIDANAVHGSDSLDNAKIEIKYFFG